MTPAQVAETLQAAVRHHQAGQLAEAEALYRRALQAQPNNPDALHLLGLVAYQRKDYLEAVRLIEGALRSAGTVPLLHFNLGKCLKDAGRAAEAAASYRRALQLDPGYQEAWGNLGNTLLDLNRPEEAEQALRRALALRPDPTTLNSLAQALARRGQPAEARTQLEQALVLAPDYVDARYNLSRLLLQLGDPETAIGHLQHIVARHPQHLDAQLALGNALHQQRRFAQAVQAYRQAQTVFPGEPRLDNNLGAALVELGQLTEARACYERVLARAPDAAEACNNLANLLKDLGELERAYPWYRRTMELRPEAAEAHSNLLLALLYSDRLTPAELFAEHLAFDARHTAPLTRNAPAPANDRDPERRLRLGYLSADLHGHHPVVRFMESILAHHDHERFEIWCYHCNPRSDATTRRLAAHADHWIECAGLDDETLAATIRGHGIDVLVDLAGHTAHNRLKTLARRPAPVQATYLGYSHSTGVSAVDYRLTDAVADPEGAERYNSERLVRLPASYYCYTPPAEAPPVGPLPARRNGRVTFGCSGNFAKMTPATFDLWAQVLGAVPGARLLVRAQSFADPAVAQRVREHFAAQGVDPGRLILSISGRATMAEQLGAYDEIDVGLDMVPYNNATNTCEALWMGVPVVALAGDRHVARMGASVLTGAGFAELIAATPADYVARAADLARDLDRLDHWRQGMRERLVASRLLDAPRAASALEDAYRRMWREWCAS